MKKRENDLMLLNVRTSTVMVRVALASALVVAPLTGALAQGLGQGQQGQGQQSPGQQSPGQQSLGQQGQGQGQAQGQGLGLGLRQGQETPAQARGVDVPFTSDSAEQGEAGEQAGQIVNGIFTIQRFVHEGSQVLAVGRITATTSNSEGIVQNFVTQARLPVLPSTTPGDVCSTLHIELGPLDVELDGRRLQLDQIAIDITAQSMDVTAAPGSGTNQLGTQLCTIGGLLDGGGLGSAGAQLAAQLNQLLGIL